MSRDKQIDEMAKLICTYPQCIHHNIIGECANTECQTVDIAENLFKQGYRKASEVAREIFEEIATILRHYDMLAERDKSEYGELIVMDIGCAIADLKKKYTESEKDNG